LPPFADSLNMQIFREIHLLKAFLAEKRLQGNSIGFVPTMGALHEGHLSIVRSSINENSVTVCSIFVNPTQFNNQKDLEKYPRTIETDTKLLEKVGCDALFCPDVETMYSAKNVIQFDFGHLDKVMEGKFRPGHFSGVALIVSKLFHIVEPDIAYFGQKDWQQFAIIRRLTQDLNFNVKLKSIPTVREQNGLAMSSRNMRLTEKQKEKALILYHTLQKAQLLLKKGTPITEVKKNYVEPLFQKDTEIKLEYFELVDSENLTSLNNVQESGTPILCMAAFVGEVRLIDNMFL
jgi:pantoate--beta-alanine ligase